MTKQELARNRNWFKYSLEGIKKPFNTEILTPEELVVYDKLMECRKSLIDNFDENTQAKGLKVSVKCWCRNRRVTNCGDLNCSK